MRDAIDELLDVYRGLLPSLQERFGRVWALVDSGGLVKTFDSYDGAAAYAEEHFPSSEVLIRHTGEAKETARPSMPSASW